MANVALTVTAYLWSRYLCEINNYGVKRLHLGYVLCEKALSKKLIRWTMATTQNPKYFLGS